MIYYNGLRRRYGSELGGVHTLHDNGAAEEVTGSGDEDFVLEVVLAFVQTVDEQRVSVLPTTM